MPRRVTRALRASLFVLGIALLLWLPVSFSRPAPGLSAPVEGFHISSHQGAVVLQMLRGSMPNTAVYVGGAPHIRLWLEPGYSRASSVGPGSISGSWHMVHLPLWLLAFICLACPVTSFLVARRRRKARGFEVEPKAGNEVSPADS